MSKGGYIPRAQESILAEKAGLDIRMVEEMAKNDRERYIELLDAHKMRRYVVADDL